MRQAQQLDDLAQAQLPAVKSANNPQSVLIGESLHYGQDLAHGLLSVFIVSSFREMTK
jgi:hypothetical protein